MKVQLIMDEWYVPALVTKSRAKEYEMPPQLIKEWKKASEEFARLSAEIHMRMIEQGYE